MRARNILGHFWTKIDPKSTKFAKVAGYFFQDVHFSWKKQTIAYPEAHGLFAGQEPPEAALAADKTSVVSAEKTSVASRAKTSVAAAEKTPDISISSTTPWGGAEGAPPGCRRFH